MTTQTFGPSKQLSPARAARGPRLREQHCCCQCKQQPKVPPSLRQTGSTFGGQNPACDALQNKAE